MHYTGGIKSNFNKKTEECIKNCSLGWIWVKFFSFFQSVFLHFFLPVLHMSVCEFGANLIPSMKTFCVYSHGKVLILMVWHFQPFCWKNLYALNAKRMKTVMQRLIHLIPFFFFFPFFTCKKSYLMKFSPQCSRNCLHFLTIFVCRWKSRGGWCKCKVSADSAMEKERKEGEI